MFRSSSNKTTFYLLYKLKTKCSKPILNLNNVVQQGKAYWYHSNGFFGWERELFEWNIIKKVFIF